MGSDGWHAFGVLGFVFFCCKTILCELGISFMASFWVGFDGWQILLESCNEHTF